MCVCVERGGRGKERGGGRGRTNIELKLFIQIIAPHCCFREKQTNKLTNRHTFVTDIIMSEKLCYRFPPRFTQLTISLDFYKMSREDEREGVSPYISLILKVIPLKLFLDLVPSPPADKVITSVAYMFYWRIKMRVMP